MADILKHFRKKSLNVSDDAKFNNFENFPENKIEIKNKNKGNASNHVPSILELDIEINNEVSKEYHMDSCFLHAKLI